MNIYLGLNRAIVFREIPGKPAYKLTTQKTTINSNKITEITELCTYFLFK